MQAFLSKIVAFFRAWLPVIAALSFMGLISYGVAAQWGAPIGCIVGGVLGIAAVIDSQRPDKPRS